MSRYVTVRVTQEDIRLGERLAPDACPITLAVRRAGYPAASVAGSWWRPFADERTPTLGRAARRFVRAFDRGKPVQPATFRLPLP